MPARRQPAGLRSADVRFGVDLALFILALGLVVRACLTVLRPAATVATAGLAAPAVLALTCLTEAGLVPRLIPVLALDLASLLLPFVLSSSAFPRFFAAMCFLARYLAACAACRLASAATAAATPAPVCAGPV